MPNLGEVILFCPAILASGALAGVAPNNVEGRNDVDPQFNVGGVYIEANTGRRYLYCRFHNGVGVASANNNIAYIHTDPAWNPAAGLAQVTSDQDQGIGGAAASTSIVAGVFTGVVTHLNFTFIQCGGRRSNVNVGAPAVGNALVSTATDGRADAQAAANISEAFGRLISAVT